MASQEQLQPPGRVNPAGECASETSQRVQQPKPKPIEPAPVALNLDLAFAGLLIFGLSVHSCHSDLTVVTQNLQRHIRP